MPPLRNRNSLDGYSKTIVLQSNWVTESLKEVLGMLGCLRILVVDVKDSILTFLHVLDADTGVSIFQVSKVVPLAVPTGLPVFHCSFSSFSADRPMMGGELELVSLQHN